MATGIGGRNGGGLRGRALVAASSLALLAAVPAWAGAPQLAQAGAATYSFAIAAKPLAQALDDFGRVTGLSVVYTTGEPAALTAPAVSGRMSADQALRQLLAGSGLTWRFTDAKTVTLEKVAADGAMVLDPVTVEGAVPAETGESAFGPVKGYVAKRSASGTKTDTPIIEVPQTINVVTADQIATTKAQSLRQALAYTPGIVSREGGDHTGDEFTIRGFQASNTSGSVYRDGTKYMVNVYDGQQEPYGLERVEVLKGAASILFGSAAPGGIINTVTKTPTLEPLHEINVEAGSYDHRQISGDFGGALTEDGKWSYRLTALKRDADTFVDHVADDRDYFAPALTWRPSGDTSLTVLSQYQQSHTAYIYGLPAGATIRPNPNGMVSSGTFVGEPGYDHYDGTTFSIGYLFDHAFSDRLKLRNSLRYSQSKVDFPSLWTCCLDSGNNATVSRGAQDREDTSSAVTSDTSLEFKWRSGPVAHTSLAGFDYTDQSISSVRYDRSAADLNLYAPSYGSGLGTPSPNSFSSNNTASRFGVYAQNQMKIVDKWVVLLGGREDWAEDRASPYFDKAWTSEHASAFSGRAGLVYLAENGLAPFVSYSESFEPQSGSDRTGEKFKPTTGQQYELGLRYQPPGTDAMVTGTVYQLTRQNVTTPDPVDPTFSTQTGEVRSRGIELEAKAAVTAHVNLIGAYAYTDARVTRSNDPAELGRRNATVPYNQFSLWGDYNLGEYGLPEVTAGGGMRYVDTTLGSSGNDDVPSYTVFDAMARYDIEQWRFAVNATNLFDKKYIASCTYDCFYGERRKVIGTLTYRW